MSMTMTMATAMAMSLFCGASIDRWQWGKVGNLLRGLG
jgi:hypothetical protein